MRIVHEQVVDVGIEFARLAEIFVLQPVPKKCISEGNQIRWRNLRSGAFASADGELRFRKPGKAGGVESSESSTGELFGI